jgi:hypothetical protein
VNVTEAARVWIEAKREMDRLKPQLEAAAEVLKEHFRKTGRATYRDRIGFATLSRLQLDTDKVKAELGARLPDFQRRITYDQLSLLK